MALENRHNVFWSILLLAMFCLMVLTGYAQNTTASDSLNTDRSDITIKRFDDLRSKYSDDAFDYEQKVASTGWWTRFKQWFNDFINDLFNFENRQDAERFADRLIEILAVILFILVIYFIVKAIFNREGQWVFGKSSDKPIIPVTDLEENLAEIDFDALTRKAETNRDFRLAVRYQYLWILKELSVLGLIDYDVEKTNSDYLNEIGSADIKRIFSYTSYLYNYIWYGEFEVDEREYDKARNSFRSFLKSIRS